MTASAYMCKFSFDDDQTLKFEYDVSNEGIAISQETITRVYNEIIQSGYGETLSVSILSENMIKAAQLDLLNKIAGIAPNLKALLVSLTETAHSAKYSL
jgi:hypothetical protein